MKRCVADLFSARDLCRRTQFRTYFWEKYKYSLKEKIKCASLGFLLRHSTLLLHFNFEQFLVIYFEFKLGIVDLNYSQWKTTTRVISFIILICVAKTPISQGDLCS